MSKSGPRPSLPSPLIASLCLSLSPLCLGLGSRCLPWHPDWREDVQSPRGVVPGPYLSHPALLIDVEVAFLPKKDLGTPAPAVTHH